MTFLIMGPNQEGAGNDVINGCPFLLAESKILMICHKNLDVMGHQGEKPDTNFVWKKNFAGETSILCSSLNFIRRLCNAKKAIKSLMKTKFHLKFTRCSLSEDSRWGQFHQHLTPM
jgi:hypothetical protein